MRPTRRTALALLLAVPAAPALAVEARLKDTHWTRSGSGPGPEHDAWDGILARSVRMGTDGIARVDYRGIDRTALAGYLGRMAAADPGRMSRAAQMAYWINLYNALTLNVVLGAYPVRSIRDIGGSLFAPGPWRQELIAIDGRRLSLDDIEHGILRPIWRDARVHYAVNCASLGCPNLAPRAYTAARMDQMLSEGARAYVNHPRGATVRDGRLVASSIYRWFAEDFGGSDAGVIAHLRTHAAAPLAGQLSRITSIADDRYDWRLNDTAG